MHATRCFEIGQTVMVGVIERRVAGNDSHSTQVSRTKRVRHGGLGPKVNHSCSPNCDRGLVAPYLLEIDRETAAP